jgi:hypothetical protein
MLFIVIFATLSVAMFGLASSNTQSSYNLSDVARAQSAAESGLRWMAFRFVRMPRPKTTAGTIGATQMTTLWPQIRTAIIDDLTTGANAMIKSSERTWTNANGEVNSPQISVLEGGATFTLNIRQTADPTVLLVTSTGRFGDAIRACSMTFKVDKKIKFAVVGKVPIQLGRNTIVEGPVAMATANKYPPILMLSDFMHLDDDLTESLEGWNEYLQDNSTYLGQTVPNHSGYDNRISVNNPQEYALATAAGYSDVNGDAYIDEYDLFVDRFDANGDLAISQAEFTNPATGQLYDAQLFGAIDSIGAPMYAGETERLGYMDGQIDNSDAYAKLRGNVTLATTADAWEANLAPSGETINDKIQGTIIPTEPTQLPVKMGASEDDIFDLDPANFEECAEGFKDRSGTAGGATINTATVKANTTLTAAMANGASVTERTPLGSTSYQATYKRPVFQNMTIRNCIIPKGLNALFDNCTFEGVTFVEGEHDITTSSGAVTYSKTEGMNWAQRKVSGDNFSKDKVLIATGTPTSGQTKTNGSQLGNNLRFNNCDFNGPIAGNYATAYTHFANSWEFTGETYFNNQVDQTATIVSPQVNIEMGSFTDPSQSPSTLVGVVVGGNIDIRGSSRVDGSIIITGDGAGNTTLAYFGASDSSTDPGAMPEGGYGKLNIRYNPYRALPDGINISVDILPQQGTYKEVIQ